MSEFWKTERGEIKKPKSCIGRNGEKATKTKKKTKKTNLFRNDINTFAPTVQNLLRYAIKAHVAAPTSTKETSV